MICVGIWARRGCDGTVGQELGADTHIVYRNSIGRIDTEVGVNCIGSVDEVRVQTVAKDSVWDDSMFCKDNEFS